MNELWFDINGSSLLFAGILVYCVTLWQHVHPVSHFLTLSLRQPFRAANECGH